MNIPAKKSLGQNFLKDDAVLERISNSVSVTSDDLILEIGSGQGALTKKLVLKGCHFLGYEIDQRMKPFLKQFDPFIIYEDFLSRDIHKDLKRFCYHHLYVVANIPYYITTPIIEHIISSDVIPREMDLLVQKEVADRFSAKPKTKHYGYFTVYLNFYFSVQKLFDVSKTSFFPVPKVDSAVVKFIYKEHADLDTKKYFLFLKDCFSNKRKTLKNNLKNYHWDQIFPILKSHGFTENVRAEEISEDVFESIFKKVDE